MNDRLEDRLIDMLEQRAGNAADVPDMPDRAAAIGRRTQRRHRILVVALAASLVAAISLASAQLAQRIATGPAPGGPASSPTTPSSHAPSARATGSPTPSPTQTRTEPIENTVVAVPPPAVLIPAEASGPAAGICAGQDGPVVIIEVNPDTPAPRCLTARPNQRLKVVNTTNRFGFTGTSVIVTLKPWPSRTLAVGDSVTFDPPLGEVFAPGLHDINLQPGQLRWTAEIVAE
jgi:hypothetical protein